jgi:hypothetical protein
LEAFGRPVVLYLMLKLAGKLSVNFFLPFIIIIEIFRQNFSDFIANGDGVNIFSSSPNLFGESGPSSHWL